MSLFSKVLGVLMIVGLLIAGYGAINWNDALVKIGLIIFVAMPIINLVRQAVK